MVENAKSCKQYGSAPSIWKRKMLWLLAAPGKFLEGRTERGAKPSVLQKPVSQSLRGTLRTAYAVHGGTLRVAQFKAHTLRATYARAAPGVWAYSGPFFAQHRAKAV